MPPEPRTALELLDDCDFPDGHLHLGVSGGADSVAMALLARAAERDFTVWHVDHGYRVPSADDAAFVRGLAEQWGVPFELHELALAPPVPNFEAVARARDAENDRDDALSSAQDANTRSEELTAQNSALETQIADLNTTIAGLQRDVSSLDTQLATLVDVTGLLIYFTVATILLAGTLL